MFSFFKVIILIAFTVLLIGCDKDDVHEWLLTAGVDEPNIKDIRYGYIEMDSIWSELSGQGISKQLILQEYNWIQGRESICYRDSKEEEVQCLTDLNSEHLEALKTKLLNKLLSQPFYDETVEEIKVPNELFFERDSRRTRYISRLALTRNFDRGVYLGPDGSMYYVDFKLGQILSKKPNFFDIRQYTPTVQLSPNGKVLLVNGPKTTELYAIESGTLLKLYEHELGQTYFSKSGDFLIHYSKPNVSAKVPSTFETVVSASFEKTNRWSRNLEYSAFDQSNNHFFSWAYASKRLNVIEFEDKPKPQFSVVRQFTLPEASNDMISKVSTDNSEDYVLVLGRQGLYSIQASTDRVSTIGKSGINMASSAPIQKGDLIIEVGHFRNNINKQGLSLTKTDTGEVGFVYLPDPTSGLIIVDTPFDNQILVASRIGLKVFTIYPQKVSFKALDLYKKQENAPKYTRPKNQGFPTQELASGNKIYKCKDSSGKVAFSDSPCTGNTEKIITFGKPNTMSHRTMSESKPLIVPKGKEGINVALRSGAIRVASKRDIDRWKRASGSSTLDSKLRFTDFYLVVKPVVFSGGLGGANSVAFIVNDQRYTPGGDIGHSVVLYTQNGSCKGVTCRMFDL